MAKFSCLYSSASHAFYGFLKSACCVFFYFATAMSTIADQSCYLPFTFRNSTMRSCLTVDYTDGETNETGQPWCSLDGNFDVNHRMNFCRRKGKYFELFSFIETDQKHKLFDYWKLHSYVGFQLQILDLCRLPAAVPWR